MASNNKKQITAPLPYGNIISFSLGDYHTDALAAVKQIKERRIVERLWNHDHTVWKPSPAEISNRLGWLHCPQQMQAHIPEIMSFCHDLKREGFRKVLLLGMGGSSLAPDLFKRIFPHSPESLQLFVLDSTDPDAILDYRQRLKPEETLYIVSTKSGTTEETLSFFKYFYNQAIQVIGDNEAGNHFIAITDPGSKLVDLAQQYRFRKIYLNDPNIGGRYSALSHFGLVPATLVGIDPNRLLECAREMSRLCYSDTPVEENPAAILGATLGQLALTGRDKLTFCLSPNLTSFGDWGEQLIAESTGKEGKGILPVVGEDLGDPGLYGHDRVFVYIHLDNSFDDIAASIGDRVTLLEKAGYPVIRIGLQDVYDVGGQFLLWEIATAIAGWSLQINPFDQPNVEAAKVRARQMVTTYKSSGALPTETPILETEHFAVYCEKPADSVKEVLVSFLESAQAGDYFSVLAYLPPMPTTGAALQSLRLSLRKKTHQATTVGYGPRFLHSTGQLHKGDRGNGLFLILTSNPEQDVSIPDEVNGLSSTMTFGILKMAQALGDQLALQDAGRRLIRIHIKNDTLANIQNIEKKIRTTR